MKKVIESVSLDDRGNVTEFNYNEDVITPVVMSLYHNGTFMPNIKNIIVNGPVTKMFFMDDTSVIVKRSDNDPMSLDAAIAFCIFKRAFGTPDENGNVAGNGFSSFLKKTVSKLVFDQGAHEKAIKAKAAAKKASADKKAGKKIENDFDQKAKPKKKVKKSFYKNKYFKDQKNKR